MSNDNTQAIRQQIEQAIQQQRTLSIHGSKSHDFMLPEYAEPLSIDMTLHHGIIDYQPTELNIKARSGTPVRLIQQTLAERGQQLPTDFPLYAESATLGGAVAIAHSGSARPFQGAIRDHILGAGLIDGSAQPIQAGGQVMKNVAGYDISRLLAGSRGTLGPILDITLKVLPIPERQQTRVFAMDENQAIQTMNRWAGQSLPITACIYLEQQLYVRLQGTDSGIQQTSQTLGGESLTDSIKFWDSIQRQTHAFFAEGLPLWRVIVPSTTPQLELENHHRTLIDWCGGLRWVYASEISQADFIHISNVGGYLEGHTAARPTHPAELLSPLQQQMHRRIKQAFDPDWLFNPVLSVTREPR